MRILTRYLIRSHIGPFLFAVSALSGLLLINVVAQRFQDLAGKGLTPGVIGEVFLLSIPHTLALTIPMGVLVAVLYAFGQMAAENEVTALKASGINIARLLLPLLLAAGVLTVGMVYFMDQVLPNANHRLANLLVDIARKSPTLQLKEQVINEIRAGDMRSRYYLQAAEIDHATNRLKDVAIYDMSERGHFRTIYADSGRMAFNAARTDLYLTLYDGWIHELESDEAATFQRVFYDKQQIRIEGVGNQLERGEDAYRSDREMSLAMLDTDIDQARQNLARVREDATSLSLRAVDGALVGWSGVPSPGTPRIGADTTTMRGDFPAAWKPTSGEPRPTRADALTRRVHTQIVSYSEEASALLDRIGQRKVEWHKKLAIPAACMVFVLIGAPLAIRFPRGGVGMVIAISLAIFGVYYIGLTGGESLGDSRRIPAFWAMWAPDVLFLMVGLLAVSQLGRVTATSRGGGWDDFLYSIRSLLTRPARALKRA